MKYSFVIPCYHSAKTIGGVVNEIVSKMQQMQEGSYEIILVDDCSGDGTKEAVFQLAEQMKNVTAVTFSKNFGQHAALLCGYRLVQGDYVISLDDDGQTPANEVDRLIDKMNEGYDVVFASYPNKQHSSFRNFGSKVNDYMARKLINKPKDLYLSSFYIARRYVIDEMVQYKNPFPYVSGLVLRTTSSICNVDVDHRSRETGSSGYTFSKLFKLWLNGFTAFSIKPLRISIYWGLIVAVFGLVLFIYSIINWFNNPAVPMGWTSTTATLAIIGGSILVVLGMIGEYIGRVYISMNDSPQYVIKEGRGQNYDKGA